MESPSFDVGHAPWITVRDLQGGAHELGIAQTMQRAHQLAGLTGDIPTQVFAITRLLLAVLHGAIGGPASPQEWRRLWDAETLPADEIDAYLVERRDRFDLLHPQTPFFQVAELRTTKDGASELQVLIADVPNGVPFFTTRLGGALDLSYAEAARWLVK